VLGVPPTPYRKDVTQFLEYHGLDPLHVEQLTRTVPEDVATWRDHLFAAGGRPDKDGKPRPATNATIARKMTALRSFFSYLQVAGYRGGNPAHPNFVDAPAMPSEGITPGIAPKLIVKLLDAPQPDTPLGLRDRAWLALLTYMAVRVEELSLINVGNIVRDGEHLTVRSSTQVTEVGSQCFGVEFTDFHRVSLDIYRRTAKSFLCLAAGEATAMPAYGIFR